MVLEADEDNLVEKVKPSTNEMDSTTLHNRGSLVMTIKEEELLQEVEEEEPLIVSINEISCDIDHLSV